MNKVNKEDIVNIVSALGGDWAVWKDDKNYPSIKIKGGRLKRVAEYLIDMEVPFCYLEGRLSIPIEHVLIED